MGVTARAKGQGLGCQGGAIGMGVSGQGVWDLRCV